MEIPKPLNDEIIGYCKVNNIPSVNDFIVKMIKRGFTIEKYGSAPPLPKVEGPKEIDEPKNITIEDIKASQKTKDLYGEH